MYSGTALVLSLAYEYYIVCFKKIVILNLVPGLLVPCNKCLKIVDLEILSCETTISIRDFQSKYWNALRTGLVLLLHRNAAGYPYLQL